MRDISPIAPALLAWYDANARIMPWRIPPGSNLPQEPYRTWLSEVMLQQTTVAAVRAYFLRFTDRWPTVTALAAAQDDAVMAEWAGLGYYARARNLLKCARAVAALPGARFPATEAELCTLPGIGPYTAAAIAAIAFDEPSTVVDGNVERVVARLFDVHTPLPKAKRELTDLATTLTPQFRPGDYAQAVMDLGATICTPRNPACAICPLRPHCRAFANGSQTTLPRKSPKPEQPTRTGILWIARNAKGHYLTERRPDRGLLGGMIGFPGTDWDTKGGPVTGTPPLQTDWHDTGHEVTHTFTHFHLRLALHTATTDAEPSRGQFTSLAAADLPTLMRKAYDLAQHALLPR